MAPQDEPGLDRRSFVQTTAEGLWDNLPSVVLAGLAFSLVATPAMLLLYLGSPFVAIVVTTLTVAPAWTALLAQEARLLGGAKAGFATMLRAFRLYWSRGVRLGLLIAAPLAVLLLVLPLLSRPQVSPGVWLMLAATIFCLFLALTLCLYAFPLLVLYDLQSGLALRNAYILAVRHIGDTAGLLSMGVLFGFAVATISPGLLLFLPAIWGLFIVNYCRIAVAEALITMQE